jgi:outer membrane protein assembly factor BamB
MEIKMLKLLFLLLFVSAGVAAAQPAWQAELDGTVRFYQANDLGVILAGTERSLYALDAQTGERLWRLATGRINETAVTPVPDTDILLVSRDLGSRSRLEAVDVMSGRKLWQSDKVRGDVLQLAADPSANLLAAVLVRDASGPAGSEVKRKPIVHMLRLSDGEELWKRELDSAVAMMPARFGDGGEVPHTLDNYRAPLLLDGRLHLFYEGATSYDAQTGKEKERERFEVNEKGLALTEADPVFDESRVYISGRGRIRAVDRRTGNIVWKADDIGSAAEMALVGGRLFARTGGRFTRLKDGEPIPKGPYGVAAVDSASGRVLWRWKGADKGLTNFIFLDELTLAVADRDDLFVINSHDGKPDYKIEHGVNDPQFVLRNENGQVIVGGREEIAAFDAPHLGRPRHARSGTFPDLGRTAARFSEIEKDHAVWRVRHKPPSRGVLRIAAGVALRAAALYFRYGGLATTGIGLARSGINLAGAVNSMRWSGLRARFGGLNLTALASGSAKSYVSRRIYSYGALGNVRLLPGGGSGGLEVIRPARALQRDLPTGPSGDEVRDGLLDRLDPARAAERISDYLLRRKRLAELRGSHMYFLTDLPRPFGRTGLVGVNVQDGKDARYVLIDEPDPDFTADEQLRLVFSSSGRRMRAFDILGN